MGLCASRTSCSLVCDTVDEYIRRLCNAELASALQLICTFAQRIMDRINRNPQAPFWSVSGAIVMTRESWLLFCAEMEGLAVHVAADCAGQGSDPCDAMAASASTASELLAVGLAIERRADLPALRAATARTADLFRKFACI